MSPIVAEQFLRLLGVTKFDKTTLPWLTGSCPLAPWRHEHGTDKTPSCGILTGKHKTKVHCFSCQFSGPPESLLAELKLRSHGEFKVAPAMALLEENSDDLVFDLSVTPEHKKGPNDVVPFPETMWNSFTKIAPGSTAEKYLIGRGVSVQSIAAYDFRWDGFQHRVCVPIRGLDHKLYGIRGRYVPGLLTNIPRYWSYLCGGITNPQVWFGEDWLDLNFPVLVTESIFGCIAARAFYPNTIAPLSASISKVQVERLSGIPMWVHLFDGDKAGRRASETLRQCATAPIKHKFLTLPEGHDPDSYALKVGRESLRELIGQVLPVHLATMP
jgi:Toprim-like